MTTLDGREHICPLDLNLDCKPECGQYDAKRNQCSRITAADAIVRIAEAAEWLRALKQREGAK